MMLITKKNLTKSNNLMEKPVKPSPTETASGPQGQMEVRVDDAAATKLPVGGFTKKRQQKGFEKFKKKKFLKKAKKETEDNRSVRH